MRDTQLMNHLFANLDRVVLHQMKVKLHILGLPIHGKCYNQLQYVVGVRSNVRVFVLKHGWGNKISKWNQLD